MPIKVHCGSCAATFQAKESLAGKKVKCPKCSAQIVVGMSKASPNLAGAAAKGSPAAFNPLIDLLDEANVKSAVRGPMCPNCSAEMKKGAILCISCGFNVETGQKVRSISMVDDDDEMAGMSETEKMLAKADRDIDEMPITGVGQDFGDGSDSMLLALVAAGIMVLMVGIGLIVIFTAETITKQYTNPGAVSFIASIVMGVVMAVWITYAAFRLSPIQGIVCLLTAGLWCIPYGFLAGRALIVPTIILLFSFVIGLGSGVYVYYKGFGPIKEADRNGEYRQIEPLDPHMYRPAIRVA